MMGGNGLLRLVGAGSAEIWVVEVVLVAEFDVVDDISPFVSECVSW